MRRLTFFSFILFISSPSFTKDHFNSLKQEPFSARIFILLNFQNVVNDISRDQGQYIDTLMTLLQVPTGHRQQALKAFKHKVAQNYSREMFAQWAESQNWQQETRVKSANSD